MSRPLSLRPTSKSDRSRDGIEIRTDAQRCGLCDTVFVSAVGFDLKLSVVRHQGGHVYACPACRAARPEPKRRPTVTVGSTWESKRTPGATITVTSIDGDRITYTRATTVLAESFHDKYQEVTP